MMIRMRSPVYFEGVFGDFSIIPIWFLRDRIQRSIDLPVICNESSSGQRIAKGRIAVSDNNSVLLQGRKRQRLELVVDSGVIYYPSAASDSYDFGQHVDRVLMEFVDLWPSGFQFRWDTDIHYYIKFRSGSGLIWCEFSGQTIYYIGLLGTLDWTIQLFGYRFV